MSRSQVVPGNARPTLATHTEDGVARSNAAPLSPSIAARDAAHVEARYRDRDLRYADSNALEMKLTDVNNPAENRRVSMGELRHRGDAQKKLANRREKVGAFLALVTEAKSKHEISQQYEAQFFVVDPNGHGRQQWDVLCLVLLAYTAVYTPIQISFLAKEQSLSNISHWVGVFAMDRFVDAIFLADIIVHFRTAMQTDEGQIFFDQRVVAKAYLRQWFWIDLASVLPYDAITYAVNSSANASPRSRLPRLLRLFRLMKLTKIARASRIFKRWEKAVNFKYGVIRLAKFFVAVCLVSHWLACGFFLATEILMTSHNSWVTSRQFTPACEKWNLDPVPAGLDRSLAPGECLAHPSDRYAAALYWGVMTLTTIGYGDIAPISTVERCYCIIAMLLGAGYYAYVVGTMCSLVQGLDVANLAFQEQMDAMNSYMGTCQMPSELRVRIRKYCYYRREMAKRAQERDLLQGISQSLRSEVVLYNHRDRLEHVPHFARAPTPFLSRIAQLLQPSVFGPNDMVMEEGQVNLHVYLVTKGRVQIEHNWAADMELEGIVSEPYGLLGERSMLSHAPADATCRTLCFTETYCMNSADVRGVLKSFPLVREHTRKLVVKKMWQYVVYSGIFTSRLKLYGEARDKHHGDSQTPKNNSRLTFTTGSGGLDIDAIQSALSKQSNETSEPLDIEQAILQEYERMEAGGASQGGAVAADSAPQASGQGFAALATEVKRLGILMAHMSSQLQGVATRQRQMESRLIDQYHRDTDISMGGRATRGGRQF